MNVKKNIISHGIAFILGVIICTTTGYFFIVRPDRFTIEQYRIEALEYRNRAINAEKRLADSIGIIETGEAKLTREIATIREAIESIREVREILSEVKNTLNYPSGDNTK